MPDRLRLTGEHHVITHVMRYNLGEQPGARGPVPTCALFTLLDRPAPGDDPAARLFERCADSFRPQVGTAAAATSDQAQGDAIAHFRASLTDALASGDYTDVVVMVMGWNTDQENALKNFNSLIGNMLDEAAERAAATRASPSGRSSSASPGPRSGSSASTRSSPTPSCGASASRSSVATRDDLGTYVLSDLVLHGILVARDDAAKRKGPGARHPRLVMIGHSFGARALVTAMTQAPSCKPAVPPPEATGFTPEDRILLLEGAFEFQYLFGPGGELAPTLASGAPRVTITASANDSAVAAAFWGWYAGDIRTYDQACRVNRERWDRLGVQVGRIGCGVAAGTTPDDYGLNLCTTDKRRPDPLRPLDGSPVRYFDASSMINCMPPLSGGGAHSDVFRRETAASCWTRCATEDGAFAWEVCASASARLRKRDRGQGLRAMASTAPTAPLADGLDTFPKLLLHNAANWPDAVAMREKDLGIWHAYRLGRLPRPGAGVALGLLSLGFRRGEAACLIGRNRPNWVWAELAAQAVGGMSLGVYADALAEEAAYLSPTPARPSSSPRTRSRSTSCSSSRAASRRSDASSSTTRAACGKYDDPGWSPGTSWSAGAPAGRGEPARFEAEVAQGRGEDVAILCTTSGTTAHPKLGHAAAPALPRAPCAAYLRRRPARSRRRVCLPPAAALDHGAGLRRRHAAALPHPGQLPGECRDRDGDLREIGPTHLLLAPRVWEQIAADVRARSWTPAR